jgi:pimeloyl-ACP methyl ester carboxylesterase
MRYRASSRHTKAFWVGRVIVALLPLVAGVSVAAQAPADRLVTSAARSWWLSCTGTGRPLVVLEAGHTESSSTWRDVQPQVATFTRVCSYDRAGRGRSPAAPASTVVRTGREAARDLRALLDAANERGPYVLVGHSLGGALVRLFAAMTADTVAGVVLVDAVHEREFEAIDALLTPEQRAAGRGMRPMSPEGFDLEAILQEVRELPGPVAWPLIVVARGRPLSAEEFPPSWSPAQRQQREELRRTLQRELVTVSSRGRLVTAGGSGHHVHHDEPAIVVAAIRELVTQFRNGERR